jgi:copper(I)-binding protein
MSLVKPWAMVNVDGQVGEGALFTVQVLMIKKDRLVSASSSPIQRKKSSRGCVTKSLPRYGT